MSGEGWLRLCQSKCLDQRERFVLLLAFADPTITIGRLSELTGMTHKSVTAALDVLQSYGIRIAGGAIHV